MIRRILTVCTFAFAVVLGAQKAHANIDAYVNCQSWGNSYVECQASPYFNEVIYNAWVSNHNGRCNGNWGWQGNRVWVRNGCSGTFAVDLGRRGGGQPPPNGCRWDNDCGWGQRCWNGRCYQDNNPPPPRRCLPSGARCGRNSGDCCSRQCVVVPGDNNNYCR